MSCDDIFPTSVRRSEFLVKQVVLTARKLLSDCSDRHLLSRSQAGQVCINASKRFILHMVSLVKERQLIHNLPYPGTAIHIPLSQMESRMLAQEIAEELKISLEKSSQAGSIHVHIKKATSAITVPRVKIDAANIVKGVLNPLFTGGSLTRSQYSFTVLHCIEQFFQNNPESLHSKSGNVTPRGTPRSCPTQSKTLSLSDIEAIEQLARTTVQNFFAAEVNIAVEGQQKVVPSNVDEKNFDIYLERLRNLIVDQIPVPHREALIAPSIGTRKIELGEEILFLQKQIGTLSKTLQGKVLEFENL